MYKKRQKIIREGGDRGRKGEEEEGRMSVVVGGIGMMRKGERRSGRKRERGKREERVVEE